MLQKPQYIINKRKQQFNYVIPDYGIRSHFLHFFCFELSNIRYYNCLFKFSGY